MAFNQIPIISIPLKKDLWVDVDSDKSYVSWYNVLKYRLKDRKKNGISKRQKGKNNKEWRNIFYELDEDEQDNFGLNEF